MVGGVLAGVVAVLFLGMGVFGLVAPAALIRPFDLRPETRNGRAEIRAVYGGFGVAVAGALGVAAADLGGYRPGILVAVIAALLGMAFGRVVSRLVDGAQSWYPIWFYLGVEVAGALVLLLALRA